MKFSFFRAKIQSIFLGLALVLLSSCFPDEIEKINNDLLGPLVKGRASIEDLSDINEKPFVEEVYSFDFGFPFGIPVCFPDTTFDRVGPYVSDELSEYFRKISVDSALVHIGITNPFPADIAAGTKIVFRKDTVNLNNSNIIFEHTINQDIAANGGRYEFDAILRDAEVRSRINFYLEPLKLKADCNVTFTNTPAEFNFLLEYFDIEFVEIRTNKEIYVIDTTEISLFEDGATEDAEADGKLVAYITNTMPQNLVFQMYMLDDQDQLIDSLFDLGRQSIKGAVTDATGEPIEISEKVIDIKLNKQRIDNFKDAKRAAVYFYANTIDPRYTGPVVVANSSTYYELQIVGDLTLTFDLGSLGGE